MEFIYISAKVLEAAGIWERLRDCTERLQKWSRDRCWKLGEISRIFHYLQNTKICKIG